MTKTLLLFVVTVLLSFGCQANNSYEYFDLSRGYTFYLTPSKHEILMGHESFYAEFCGTKNDLYCIESERLKFAFPKSKLKLGSKKSWKHAEILYCIINETKTRYKDEYVISYLVGFTKAKSCNNLSPQGARFLFNYQTGLTFIDLLSKSAKTDEIYYRLFNINDKGFPL
jgi:hypothetical protein